MSTATPPRAVALHLSLHHTHPFGQLAPYFHGLEAERAIASRCPACARTWFPPRLDCPDHRQGIEWVELPGSGHVRNVTVTDSVLPFGTEAAHRAFALVAFDGAENLAFGRLAGPPEAAAEGQIVWISRAPGTWPHPAQAACFVLDPHERKKESLP